LLLFILYPSFAFAAGDKWSLKGNRAAIFAELNANSEKFQCASNCNNEIFNEYSQILSSGEKMVVITSSIDPEQADCRGCAPELSLFIFGKTNNKWKRETALMAFTRRGSWGEVGEESVAVEKLSSDQLGLFLEGGFIGQGYFNAVLELHLITNGAMQMALNYCTVANNIGVVGENSKDLEDWDSSYEILLQAGRLANIQVKLVDNVSGAKSISLFAYDGQKYISAKGDPRLNECV